MTPYSCMMVSDAFIMGQNRLRDITEGTSLYPATDLNLAIGAVRRAVTVFENNGFTVPRIGNEYDTAQD